MRAGDLYRSLERLTKSDSALLAASPSLHPLGFLRLQLPNYDQAKYRLHIWGALPIVPQDDQLLIHDHNFSFVSHCVIGIVETRNWRLERDAAVASRRLYRVSYDDSGSKLRSFRKCSVEQESDWRGQASGSSYAIEMGQFHEARPRTAFAATVVEVLARSPAHPRVVGPIHYPEQVSFTRRSLSAMEISSARQAIFEALRVP